jgi:hypothetical protein
MHYFVVSNYLSRRALLESSTVKVGPNIMKLTYILLLLVSTSAHAGQILFQGGQLISCWIGDGKETCPGQVKPEDPNLPSCTLQVGYMGEGPYQATSLSGTESSPYIFTTEDAESSADKISMDLEDMQHPFGTPQSNPDSAKPYLAILSCWPPKSTGKFLDTDAASKIIHDAIPEFFPAIFDWESDTQ